VCGLLDEYSQLIQLKDMVWKVADRLQKVQMAHALYTREDDIFNELHFSLMDVVYNWAQGMVGLYWRMHRTRPMCSRSRRS
jgi:superfamily II RNA helicase